MIFSEVALKMLNGKTRFPLHFNARIYLFGKWRHFHVPHLVISVKIVP